MVRADLRSALESLDCAALSYDEWIRVGMALKAEGCGPDVWDRWSRTDPARYRPGECERKWATFRRSEGAVTGGTLVRMARDRGWTPSPSPPQAPPRPAAPDLPPGEELLLYLGALFRPEEYVGYCTTDAWQPAGGGKWVPGKGVHNRTAKELCEALIRHPEDPGAAVGDWKPEAGAWIRFNPLDGRGCADANVTRLDYALVESDEMPAAEQEALYRRLELPIAALVHSGKRSVHAIVRVDAPDPGEYRRRVDKLYAYLRRHGMKVDTQNRNPSRYSRMPGVTRGGQRQRLLALNIGKKDWAEWEASVDEAEDGLPPVAALGDFAGNPPPLPEELIRGVLRRGHKMLISGSSKAGKTFLLMELCAAIAGGTDWLGFQCRKGRVLYINLEIDAASCVHRFLRILDASGADRECMKDILIWNLRGHAVPMDRLVPQIVRRARRMDLDAIIIDPIYKVITGDENSARDMADFCNQFDRICRETGCAAIYCHHHSKGAQGAKRAMDRASGSGVFARDPDAQLDMIELEISEEVRNTVAETGATAWRMECSLREFPNFTPFEFWFEYPVHRVDRKGYLKDMPYKGTFDSGRLANRFSAGLPDSHAEAFRNAFYAQQVDGVVTVQDMMSYLGVSDKTVYSRIRRMQDEFILSRGKIMAVKQ